MSNSAYYIWIKLEPWTIDLLCHKNPTYYDNRIIEGLLSKETNEIDHGSSLIQINNN